MQCKDIPDEPILELIWNCNDTGGSANWYFGDERDVKNAMPKLPNEKLALAKMRQLMKRGLVGGCTCGCRGDFEITDRGCEMIGRGAPSRRVY